MKWSVVATWKFSLQGVDAAANTLLNGGRALDAVEEAAIYAENDTSVDSVGFGGFPNIDGEIELDAAIMDGYDLSIGAVAAIKGYKNPISIARKVLIETPHNILVGQGAEEFAAKMGFEKTILLTEEIIKAWYKKKEELKAGKRSIIGHDTIGVLALDTSSNMASGTSTSGSGLKHKGRVGDSPLVGSGFYVDNSVGGAVATGLGEDIMKCCTCFYAVELMRQGYHPKEAAEIAVKRTHTRIYEKTGKVGNIALVCADNQGNFGGAANHKEFSYAAASDKCSSKIYIVEPITTVEF
jgi:isoaspartyl peptidase/L-asparaginase-like protein (Ntn-hydrolase superfamily)